ncbi:MAG: SLOG family protein [Bacillota bacterium]|nr:SLOG family protein [Bacillota bacterium]
MRPHKLPGKFDLSGLLSRLEEEIRKTVLQGCDTFQTGMAMGVDIWAAEIIIKLKSEYPRIRLICCLPCETQADNWPDEWREKYFDTLVKADEVVCLQKHYTAGCMQRRNRAMIGNSSRLIAVHDKISAGGTAQTINYAKTKGLKVFIVNP